MASIRGVAETAYAWRGAGGLTGCTFLDLQQILPLSTNQALCLGKPAKLKWHMHTRPLSAAAWTEP